MQTIISQHIHRFLAWGTHPNVIPYIPAVLIMFAGFFLMWKKAHWATIPHELGHAIVALCLGKKLGGININRDTSGDTQTLESRYKNPLMNLFVFPFKWIRNVLVSFAGYPGPFLLAYVLMYFWQRDQAKISLVIVVALLIFTLAFSTNMFGFLMVVCGLIVTGLALWIGSPLLAEIFIVFLTGGMLAGGIKGIQEAWLVYQQDKKQAQEKWHDPFYEPQHSDARALSRRTLVPQIVWLIAFSGTGLWLILLTLREIVEAYH